MAREDYRDDDNYKHFNFTGRQRYETAMHTLHGIVQGVAADAKINDAEVKRLIQWASHHAEFADKHPFNEVLPVVNTILADGVVDEEERADLLWLSNKFKTKGSFYDKLTADVQRLHGFLSGIIADGVINDEELRSLQEWVDEHTHLRTCWPYDELETIIFHVMRDGKVDDQEHEALMQFFGEFDFSGPRRAVGAIERECTVSGVCAMSPDIIFLEQLFCFTGTSERGTRNHLASVVEQLGGRFHPNVIAETNYLVIGADGNPCWAYACYGRKVESAVQRRRKGQRILIVHEYDFWDAVEDSK